MNINFKRNTSAVSYIKTKDSTETPIIIECPQNTNFSFTAIQQRG